MTNQEQRLAEPNIVAYCRQCGKALTEQEARFVAGTVFCVEHAPAPASSAAPTPNPPAGSPGVAFLLGLIPGVGAIYNGQYAKGLIHVVIFGLLISVLNAGVGRFEPLFAMLLAAWYFYMPFEAYHTARKRQLGQPVDEWSGLFSVPRRGSRTSLAGPVALIVLGVIFLLINLDLLDFEILVRYWPVLLIIAGLYLLLDRLGVFQVRTAQQKEDSGESTSSPQ